MNTGGSLVPRDAWGDLDLHGNDDDSYAMFNLGNNVNSNRGNNINSNVGNCSNGGDDDASRNGKKKNGKGDDEADLDINIPNDDNGDNNVARSGDAKDGALLSSLKRMPVRVMIFSYLFILYLMRNLPLWTDDIIS
jgi:hypothetical protein